MDIWYSKHLRHPERIINFLLPIVNFEVGDGNTRFFLEQATKRKLFEYGSGGSVIRPLFFHDAVKDFLKSEDGEKLISYYKTFKPI